ncbi:MAG TPA: sugar phosphate isomerase/epimerase family protein [Candidatus Humimicrobiaceae bacterium]
MIRLGMHADNLRVLSGSFKAGVEMGAKYKLEHLEFGVIYGIYFVQTLGYEPSVSMWENPLAIRKFVESKGMTISQIDSASPMMSTAGSNYGVLYTQQAIRFASHLGAKKVDTTDSAVIEDNMTKEEAFVVAVKNYTQLLKWAEDFKIIVNIETHGALTNDAEFMLKLLSHFESEYLGFNLDTGNTFISGQIPLDVLKPLRKYLTHCHIKDVSAELAAAVRGEETGIASSDQSIGAGVNAENIKNVINYLKETKWNGDVSVECAGTDDNMKKSVDWLRSIV